MKREYLNVNGTLFPVTHTDDGLVIMDYPAFAPRQTNGAKSTFCDDLKKLAVEKGYTIITATQKEMSDKDIQDRLKSIR